MLNVTTELDAINIMLSVIGESPINSLSDLLTADAAAARNVLAEVSKAVQSKGWNFNRENAYPFTPDSNTKQIPIPPNFIYVEPLDIKRDIAIRGNKLYDKDNHTYSFDDDFKADVIQILNYNELPEQARYYIAIRASRIFQTRILGSDTLYKFSQEEEYQAKAELLRYDNRMGNRSYLNPRPNIIQKWHPAKALLR